MDGGVKAVLEWFGVAPFEIPSAGSCAATWEIGRPSVTLAPELVTVVPAGPLRQLHMEGVQDLMNACLPRALEA